MKRIKVLSSIPALGFCCLLVTGMFTISMTAQAGDTPTAATASAPGISVQLWSVKDSVKSDFEGTLKKLASMGFQGVEFANEFGPYADDPGGLKQFLERNNLRPSGAHTSFELLNAENFDTTVTFYKALGCERLIIAWDDRSWHPEKVHDVVKELNALAEKLATHDMQIGYHNHAEEFGEYRDSTYWDFIAQSTGNDVLLQMDVGWVSYAGKDPVEYVHRYPGRTVTTHYKIRTREGDGTVPIIGKDKIDWSAVLAANVAVGGTRWIVVEQEEYPEGMTPLQAVEASKKGLDGYLADR